MKIVFKKFFLLMIPVFFVTNVLAMHHSDGVVINMVFDNDDETILLGTSMGSIKAIDPVSGEFLSQDNYTKGIAYAMAFSHDRQQIAFGYENGRIDIFDRASKARIRRLSRNVASIKSLAFAPDGTTLAAGTRDGMIFLWDLTTNKLKSSFKNESTPSSLTFSPDSATLVYWQKNDAVFLDLATAKIDKKPFITGFFGSPFAFSSLGLLFIFDAADKSIKPWDVFLDFYSSPIKPLVPDVTFIAISADNKLMALATSYGVIETRAIPAPPPPAHHSCQLF